MTGAMYAAIGGLKVHMSNLNVIGNNVANVNTVGYKAQRMTFQESIYSMSKAGSNGTLAVGGNNPSQIGYGASIGSIDLNMNPGTYSPTGYDLDCMMMGEGFFLVGDKNVSVSRAADLTKFDLTRVGDFWKDPLGFIADRGGAVAYGFQVVQNPFMDKNDTTFDSVYRTRNAKYLGYNTGNGLTNLVGTTQETMVSATLGPMRLPLGAAAPTASNGGLLEDGTHVWEEGDPVYDLLGPVVRSEQDGTLSRGVVSLADIVEEAVANVADSNNAANDGIGATTLMTIGEDEETARTVYVYEAYSENNNPSWRVFMDANKNILKIEFNDGTGRADGGLLQTEDFDEENPTYNLTTTTWPALNGNTNYVFDPDTGKLSYTNADGDIEDRVRSTFWEYDGPIPNKDALPIEAASMSVGAQGGITGITDTGLTFTAGYLGVGSCASNDGVTNIGGPYYKCQEGSGDMRVAALGGLLAGRYIGGTLNITLNGVGGTSGATTEYQPNALERILSGGTNEIKNGGLEASGTDVATEFSNMIITQRGYQANTRIVTVTDSMLEELVNMKR